MKTIEEIQAIAADYAREITAHTPKTVDDVYFSASLPKGGVICLQPRMDSNVTGHLELRAETDDLNRLKQWMEQVAKELNPADTLMLADGQYLCLHRLSLPESAVEKTKRFLDELVPSTLSVLLIQTKEGGEYRFIVKTKHFVTQLYMALLVKHVHPDDNSTQGVYMEREWFSQTPHAFWYTRCRHSDYYNAVKSLLVEWYMHSSVPWSVNKPQFRTFYHVPAYIDFWADFGGSIFWNEHGASIGDVQDVSACGLDFEFYDMPELEEWYNDFIKLTDKYCMCTGDAHQDPLSVPEIVEWQKRGYAIAKKLRSRLPVNLDIIYSLTWDLAFGSRYHSTDRGHVLFDERLYERE